MKTIRSFDDLTAHLQSLGRRFRFAVVCGSDESTLSAVLHAVDKGFAEALFVGDCTAIEAHPDVAAHRGPHLRFIPAATHEEAAARAVALVREGEADVVVKGLLHTATLLRAVLNKAAGLLPAGAVLTHIAAAAIPGRPKLLFYSDAAVIPYPTDEQRAAQVGYMAALLHRFGIAEPRVALIHCAETVSDKFPHTLGYAALCDRARAGEWGPLILDGPLDLRTACDPVALRLKGISSPLQGEADGLILPDVEAGNVLYKCLTTFCGAESAGTLCGTTAPVVLPSRGDDATAKYNSLALAIISRQG